ncbi:MAG: hypothetical protein ACREP3_07065 [Candidatus Binatia bacterium]
MADAKTSESINAESGHELSDLSPRNISLFGAGLAVLIIVVLLASYAMMVWLRDGAARRAEPPSPLSTTREPTPGPELLVEPGRAMKAMRQQEEARLKSYGWIDQEKGIAHIPIERAIDMLAEQGLPARPRKAQSTGETRAGKEAGARPGEPER